MYTHLPCARHWQYSEVHLDPWKQSGLTLSSGCMGQFEIQNNCTLNIKFRTPTYYKYWIILHMDPGHRPVGGGSPCIRKHIKYPPQGITYDLYRGSHSDVPCLAIIFHRWLVSRPGVCGVMHIFDPFWHLRTNCVCGHPVQQSQHATRDLRAGEYDVLNGHIDPSITCAALPFTLPVYRSGQLIEIWSFVSDHWLLWENILFLHVQITQAQRI